MGAPEFQYKNPLILELGNGVSGSVNGESFTSSSREIQGNIDETVTLNIGQAVETTSNVTFNNLSSSAEVKIGDNSLLLGDGDPIPTGGKKAIERFLDKN